MTNQNAKPSHPIAVDENAIDQPISKDYSSDEDWCTVAEIEEAVAAFLAGDLTLAQLEGLSAEELYQVADLGYDLAAEGKLEDARKIFEGLYCYNPYDAYFHAALGSIYQKQSQLQSALDHYETAVELWDEDIHSWTNAAEVALQLATDFSTDGDNDEAEVKFVFAAEALQRAVALDPKGDHPAGLRARAIISATVGSMETARV